MINPAKPQSALQIRERPKAQRQESHGRTINLGAFGCDLEWGRSSEPLCFVGFDDGDEDEPTIRELLVTVLRRLAKRFKRGPR